MTNIRPRLIPVLQIKDSQLYKSKKYKSFKYVGDPINAVRIFNEKQADELSIIDVNASKKGKDPDYKLIDSIASECFMPLSYGGGITNIDQAKRIFKLGVEKIIVKSSFYKNPKLIETLSNVFGCQSIVVCIDYRYSRFRRCLCSVDNFNRIIRNHYPSKDVELAQKIGAGEVILNNTDLDGTFLGLNNNLIMNLKSKVNIPIINMGGCNGIEDISRSLKAGFSGVMIGSLFVFHGVHNAVLISYPDSKDIDNI